MPSMASDEVKQLFAKHNIEDDFLQDCYRSEETEYMSVDPTSYKRQQLQTMKDAFRAMASKMEGLVSNPKFVRDLVEIQAANIQAAAAEESTAEASDESEEPTSEVSSVKHGEKRSRAVETKRVNTKKPRICVHNKTSEVIVIEDSDLADAQSIDVPPAKDERVIVIRDLWATGDVSYEQRHIVKRTVQTLDQLEETLAGVGRRAWIKRPFFTFFDGEVWEISCDGGLRNILSRKSQVELFAGESWAIVSDRMEKWKQLKRESKHKSRRLRKQR